jgi:hypothetical protein
MADGIEWRDCFPSSSSSSSRALSIRKSCESFKERFALDTRKRRISVLKEDDGGIPMYRNRVPRI